MPIVTNKNKNFGGNLITQKYSPLQDILFTPADTPVCDGILVRRSQRLANLGVFPQPLALCTVNWANVVNAEVGREPPIVVISSNRSGWIVAGLQAADTQLEWTEGAPARFTDVADLRALLASADQRVSPPIYCPKRVEGNRGVYVVVHTSEYTKYKVALTPYGITVIGWQFQAPAGPAVPRLVGLGASRFAAVTFMRTLRDRVAAAGGHPPWRMAWLFDDNVVALTAFPGLAAAETALLPDQVCVGFDGTTVLSPRLDHSTWAAKEIASGRAKPAAMPAVWKDKGLLQQAVLWNVDSLTANGNLNFSPVFVTGGEDMSLASYFDRYQIPYRFYGIGVLKELVSPDWEDGDPGAQTVRTARQHWAQQFATLESAPPPPAAAVQVKPVKDDDGGVQTLGDFVLNRVLPGSQIGALAAGAPGALVAQCQAGEQIARTAIAEGFLTKDAMQAALRGHAVAVITPDAP